MIDPTVNAKSNGVSVYFIMAILFIVVVTVLFMIVNNQAVPNFLAVPFSLIISYLLGVKTPTGDTNNADTNV